MKHRILSLLLALTLCLTLTVPTLAIPLPVAEQSPHFLDVPTSHWAYSYIERAYADGVVSGTSGDAVSHTGIYSPDDSLNNAQLVTILTRAFLSDAVETEIVQGNTTPWYAPYLAVSNDKGLLTGTAIQENPEAIATRYDMAATVVAVLNTQGTQLPTTADLQAAQTKIGDWSSVPTGCQNSVAIAYSLGLISGINDQGDFSGSTGVTRGAMATVYCKLAEITAEHPPRPMPNSDNFHVSLDAIAVERIAGEPIHINATVAGSQSFEIEWTSSNESVAKVVETSRTKQLCKATLYTYDPGVAITSCTITNQKTGEMFTSTCRVTVTEQGHSIPEALSHAIHVPAVDYWSQLPTKIQEISD